MVKYEFSIYLLHKFQYVFEFLGLCRGPNQTLNGACAT